MEKISPLNNEKQVLWENAFKKCETIVDGLGLEMDENIKECVVGLWMNDFNTAGSCGGHKEEVDGKVKIRLPYVYIKQKNEPDYRYKGEKEVVQSIKQKFNLTKDNDIFDDGVIEKEYQDAMESIYENGEVEEYREWRKLDKSLEEKTLALIEEYNSSKNGNFLRPSGIFPGIRIEYATQEKNELELEKAQKEFTLFAEYLKNRYFNQ